MKLSGKCAAITGAAVGIGFACAVRFAMEGAKVVLLDLDAEKLCKAKKTGRKIYR